VAGIWAPSDAPIAFGLSLSKPSRLLTSAGEQKGRGFDRLRIDG
jgi:hypothetical protein